MRTQDRLGSGRPARLYTEIINAFQQTLKHQNSRTWQLLMYVLISIREGVTTFGTLLDELTDLRSL